MWNMKLNVRSKCYQLLCLDATSWKPSNCNPWELLQLSTALTICIVFFIFRRLHPAAADWQVTPAWLHTADFKDIHRHKVTQARPRLPCASRLIFAGRQMNDDKTARDYNIEGGSVLHLVSDCAPLMFWTSRLPHHHALVNLQIRARSWAGIISAWLAD